MRVIQEAEGFKVGGVNINNICFADDTVIIADSQEKLQHILDTINQKSEELGLRINISKTKCMVVSKKNEKPRCNLVINNEPIEQVPNFNYLGSIIEENAKCDMDIRKRIAIAKNAFTGMKNLLTNSHISIATRKRAVKTFVWSVLLYGMEAWTINGRMVQRLEAMEMWCWRRVWKIPWTARITNNQVLERMGTTRELMTHIRRRQMKFLGHVMRREKIESVVMTGRIDGTRDRGLQREKYMDGIVRATGNGWTAGRMLQATKDRHLWFSMTANIRSDTAHR